jgi:glycosyltransferase involved in cell wall biosynthesis
MRCPSLSELPAPPAGKTGWPWTESSSPSPDAMPLAGSCPRISVVTPSFNQGTFIEEALRSVILQGYPNLEYIVLDGGSTDGTLAIVEKYRPWLDYWHSGPDGGQSAALNRGLRMASGVMAAWINSDDMLCKNALLQHFAATRRESNVVYVGDCVHIDEHSRTISVHRGTVHSLEDLLRIASVWRAGGCIDQPAVLFPRELLIRVGGFNENNHYAMDYELWGKFLLHGARLFYTEVPFGCFRWHSQQKTQDRLLQTDALLDSAAALTLEAESLLPGLQHELLAELRRYRLEYPNALWRDSGRLARIGLPRSLVTMLRNSRDKLAALERRMPFAGGRRKTAAHRPD